MAESIWSYEGDVAPQKGSFFSDVPRTGSRISYTSPESRRYTAGVLAPAQAAIRQAEEEELKRRDDELVYQRNKAILEEGKAEAKLKADMLAMEDPLTARLAEIQPLIESDPLKAKSALSGLMIQNSKVVSSSEGIQFAITQMANAIASSEKQRDDLDSSTFRQFQTSLNSGDRDSAKNFMGQLKDAARINEANTLFNSTAYEAKARQDFKTAETNIAAQEKAADEQSKTIKAAREQLYNLDTELVPGAIKDGPALKKFTDESMLKLKGVARELRLSEEEIEKGLKDPFGFQQELVERSFNSVAGTGAKSNVGTVTGTMTPSP
jgi:hypothetical protein